MLGLHRVLVQSFGLTEVGVINSTIEHYMGWDVLLRTRLGSKCLLENTLVHKYIPAHVEIRRLREGTGKD